MKVLSFSLASALAAAGLALASPVSAEPGPGPDARPGRGHRVGRAGGGGFGHGAGGPQHFVQRFADMPTTRVLETMTRRLDLTEEQQQKILPILQETQTSLKAQTSEARELLKQARTKIGEHLTPEQKEKAAELKEALFAGVGSFVRARGPEIRERMQDAGQEVRVRVALAQLDLNEEQRGKLKTIGEEVQKKRQEIMESVRPQMEALREEAKTRVTEVLTPEQQKELDEELNNMPKGPGHGPGHGPGAGAGPGQGRRGGGQGAGPFGQEP